MSGAQAHQRAARVIAALDKRTVRNGCTRAEAKAAKAKADLLRSKYPALAVAPSTDAMLVQFGALIAAALFDAIMRKSKLKGFARTKKHKRVFTFK